MNSARSNSTNVTPGALREVEFSQKTPRSDIDFCQAVKRADAGATTINLPDTLAMPA